MSEATESRSRPPPELVPGEALLWKMADVKGLITRRLVTGYLVTTYRCFIWNVGKNEVTANIPMSLTDVTVEGKRQGKRTLRGGSFIVPRTPNYVTSTMGETVEIGDLFFRVEGELVMVFRDVAEPVKVKGVIDAVRAQVRVPGGLGVDILWRSPDEPAKRRA
jgi:hypothetical protein